MEKYEALDARINALRLAIEFASMNNPEATKEDVAEVAAKFEAWLTREAQ